MGSVVAAMHFNILVSLNWIFFDYIFLNFQGEELVSRGCWINPLHMFSPRIDQNLRHNTCKQKQKLPDKDSLKFSSSRKEINREARPEVRERVDPDSTVKQRFTQRD